MPYPIDTGLVIREMPASTPAGVRYFVPVQKAGTNTILVTTRMASGRRSAIAFSSLAHLHALLGAEARWSSIDPDLLVSMISSHALDAVVVNPVPELLPPTGPGAGRDTRLIHAQRNASPRES